MTNVRWTFNAALGLSFAVLGAVILVLVPDQIGTPPRLFGMQGNDLSPRAMPRLVAGLMIVTGLAHGILGLRLDEPNGLAALGRQSWRNLAFLLAAMIAYVALLIPLGFVLSSVLAALAITLYFGSRSPVGILIVAVAAPLAIYLLFTRQLSVSLPTFPLYRGF